MQTRAPGDGEFVLLIALLISLVALATDAMLPALPNIGSDLGVIEENDRQLVITVFFLGLAIGQIFYGPLSDSTGRKPAIYAGLGVFLAGSLLSVIAHDFDLMLIGRFLQGLGSAGPRIVVLAMVRDRHEGRAMARIMSAVMAVFIIVPAVAPAVGQGLMVVSGWRSIFVVFFAIAVLGFAWLYLRQPETLAPNDRKAFSPSNIYASAKEVFQNSRALGYMLATGAVFAPFIGYLISSQQIFQELYGAGDLFSLYFAILALAIGIASLANSRLVMHYGMRALCKWALIGVTILCTAYTVYAWTLSGVPPLWSFMACFILSFFAMGILFGNLNALAMEPMGHIAGTAAAVIGSVTTGISLVFGAVIGGLYDASVIPLVAGFALFSFIALVIVIWTDAVRSRTE